MAYRNHVELMGRLGADPEMKGGGDGKSPFATFTVATNYRRKGFERVEWHSLIAFDKYAEFISQYLRKGDEVFVEGRLQSHTYKDSAGIDRKVTEIVVESIQPIGAARRTDSSASDVRTENSATPPDDDIPF